MMMKKTPKRRPIPPPVPGRLTGRIFPHMLTDDEAKILKKQQRLEERERAKRDRWRHLRRNNWQHPHG
jgi:hypothetical protein